MSASVRPVAPSTRTSGRGAVDVVVKCSRKFGVVIVFGGVGDEHAAAISDARTAANRTIVLRIKLPRVGTKAPRRNYARTTMGSRPDGRKCPLHNARSHFECQMRCRCPRSHDDAPVRS